MSDPPYVFGIGLSRTGTRSLANALGILGWKCIHFPSDKRTFEQLRIGDFRLDVLKQFNAATDTPIAAYFPQFDALFESSMFILTVRDPATWLTRVEAFWRRTHDEQLKPFHRFINTAVYGTWTYQRERFEYVYRRHIAEVRNYFASRPQRLLMLDICGGQGWGELCAFLDRPVPRVPFPHENAAPPGG
jgi:Sulfotransferase domain